MSITHFISTLGLKELVGIGVVIVAAVYCIGCTLVHAYKALRQ